MVIKEQEVRIPQEWGGGSRRSSPGSGLLVPPVPRPEPVGWEHTPCPHQAGSRRASRSWKLSAEAVSQEMGKVGWGGSRLSRTRGSLKSPGVVWVGRTVPLCLPTLPLQPFCLQMPGRPWRCVTRAQGGEGAATNLRRHKARVILQLPLPRPAWGPGTLSSACSRVDSARPGCWEGEGWEAPGSDFPSRASPVPGMELRRQRSNRHHANG